MTINSGQAESQTLGFESDAFNRFFQILIPKHAERRESERIPFCRPVTVYFDEEPIPVSGLVRDISQTGIGMTHECPVSPQEATIRISNEDGGAFCARIEILWCRNVTKGFYISGGRFVRVFESDPLLNRYDDCLGLEF